MSVFTGLPAHIGYVVKNITETTQYLSSVHGVGPWRILEAWPTGEELLMGEPYGLKCAYATLGGMPIELLEPLEGDTIWSRAAAAGQEGIHHLCYTVANWDETVQSLIDSGGKMTQGATYKGKRWCYIDLQTGGFLIEIAEEGLGE